MPNWTQDQQKAISTRGGKIIVSAAAGSGKTAVLSERVIEYILAGGSVSKLLVVTFTNAAAEEMKIRIKNKIKDAFDKNPDNNHLKKELSLVDSSDITTMDAFYGDLVKDNFEKIGIDKNFKILSKEEETNLKETIVIKLQNELFDKLNNFNEILDFYKATDIDLIKDLIFKISSFLDTVPNQDEVINKIIGFYDRDYYKNKMFKEIHNHVNSIKELYKKGIENLYNDSDKFEKAIDIFNKDLNYMNDIIKINNFDELSSRIRTMSFDNLRCPSGEKDNQYYMILKTLRDEFKVYKNNMLDEFMNMSDKIYNDDMMICKQKVEELLYIVKEFRRMLLEEKMKLNKFSFSDISHFVIELLISNNEKTNLAKNLSKKYDEILIDEYQDTNNLQNIIFNAISNNNSNLFIVGDVKQSIYKFRNAAPEIFNEDKNNAYVDKFPKLITLSKNFRSRNEVLDFSNFVFDNIMTNEFGEVNYDKDERLYLGANYPEGNNLDTEVIIIDGKEKSDKEEDIKNIEKEAIIVADKIKYLLDSKYQVYDNKLQQYRNIKESDIAILLRSMTNSKYFIEALNNRKISVYAIDSSVYFDNYEVKLIINILKLIDNPYDDVALMSLLNSKYVDISMDKIVDVRCTDKYKYLYENLLDCDDEEIKNVIGVINDLKAYSKNHSICELLSKVYNTFDVLAIASADKQGINKEKNLVQMIKHANDFENGSIKSLHEFINYLEQIILNKDSLEGINPLSDSNNVLLTTIHKSKGLEYPVVFISEMGKKFNMQDLKDEVMINEENGLVFNIVDNKYRLKYKSVPLILFKTLEKNKALSEELRILYVALTRAKEKIIMTGYTSNLENLVTKAASKIGDNKIVSSLYLKKTSTFLEMLIPPLLRHPSSKELRYLSSIDVKTFDTNAKLIIDIKNAADISEEEFNTTKVCKEQFDIDWFNKIVNTNFDKKQIPSYLSVSEIKHSTKYNRTPNFMSDGISHTSLGTLYHKIFELLPVKKYSISLLKEELNNLVNSGAILEDEIKLINMEKIFAYLTTDIYDMMTSCKEIYKEKEITFEIPSTYYDKEEKSGNILTSGIIDLLFVYEDTYYIVDYKTDKVDTLEELKDRYKIQLDLYEIGIRNIMNASNVKKYLYSINLNKFIEV